MKRNFRWNAWNGGIRNGGGEYDLIYGVYEM
jgi:hypothetical protein